MAQRFAPPLAPWHGGLSPDSLARLMPMYLELDSRGVICAQGPTLAKLVAGPGLLGQPFFARFDVRRPSHLRSMAQLLRHAGDRLQLELRDPTPRPIGLRGLAVPTGSGGAVVNLSFGIGIVDAVRQHDLTDDDFTPTDLCVELLYLVEANAAVLAELHALNRRLHGAMRMAEEQAATDALTGLRNRRALDFRLHDLAQRGDPFALMHIDLDYFKQVNDRLGHAAGDHVLTAVARILSEETRGTDIVARTGGDEFVILLPGPCETAGVMAVAERICARLRQPIPFAQAECRISGSVGVCMAAPGPAPIHPDHILAEADRALYAAKAAGRGQVRLSLRALSDTTAIAPDGTGAISPDPPSAPPI